MMLPFVPRLDHDDVAELARGGQAPDQRQPGLHLAVDLGVDVDARQGRLERRGRGEHDGIADRRHLSAGDPRLSATARHGRRRGPGRLAAGRRRGRGGEAGGVDWEELVTRSPLATCRSSPLGASGAGVRMMP